MHLFRNIFILVLIGVSLMSCDNDSPSDMQEKNRSAAAKPSLRIKIDKSNPVRYGDTLRITVEPTDPNLVLTKVSLGTGDGAGIFGSSPDGNFRIATTAIGGGEVKLKVDATFTDGQTSTRYKDLRIVAAKAPTQWGFEVKNRYPHDVKSFTQGLLIHNGFLYEGTGSYGESRLRKLELTTGKVLQEKHLDDSNIFGEGITILGNKMYQLTYTTSIGYIYDLETFKKIDEFTYNTATAEGWGLTNNDTELIASDGSAMIYFYDPVGFKELRRIRVFDHQGEVSRLNELEYKDGVIYANIYTTTEIVQIDAKTGQVLNRYDARGMVERSEVTSGMDVLNGIAINPANGHLLLTGKYWSKMYEVAPMAREEL